MPEKLDISTLEQWLWDCAFQIRGPIDAPKYKDYIINTVASGCVEIDDRGRIDILWVAGKKTGFTFKNLIIQYPDDAVKVVHHDNVTKIHPYPTGSQSWIMQKCELCGKPVVSSL